jgi:hypothetical protein
VFARQSEFAAPVGNVVYVEGLIGFIYLNRPKEIERYQLIFDALSSVAYNQDASVEKIADISEKLGHNGGC